MRIYVKANGAYEQVQQVDRGWARDETDVDLGLGKNARELKTARP